MRRVVITGIGVFASTGKNAESFFETLVQGRSAIRRIQQFDPAALSVQIAAEIPDYDPLDYFPAKRLDLLDRFSQFALLAAKEAMDSSGIQLRDEERPRFGVVTGTGMGGRPTLSNPGYYKLFAEHATRLHPFTIPKIMHNAATSQICMEFGAQGPSLTTATACSSSGHAIGEAFHLIKFGMADMMLTGGTRSADYLRNDPLVGIGARAGHGQWRPQQSLPAFFRRPRRIGDGRRGGDVSARGTGARQAARGQDLWGDCRASA